MAYKMEKLALMGSMVWYCDTYEDQRGITFKPYQREALLALGIADAFNEDLIVTNKKNVIRGMHFQQEPYGQAKMVFCLHGAILDVMLDIRRQSPTYGQFITVEITQTKHNVVYIPAGLAHGYLSLADETVVGYKLSGNYCPEAERGIRWDSFGFDWMRGNREKLIISEKDAGFPDFLR